MIFFGQETVITNERILPTTKPSESAVTDRLETFASPGQYVPLSFAIYTPQRLENVRVEIADLVSSEGKIERRNVDIRVVKCWYQAGIEIVIEGKFLTPELLLKDDSVIDVDLKAEENRLNFTGLPQDSSELLAFNIPADSSKQVWLTVHVPPQTPSGKYEGSIRVSARRKHPRNLKVSLDVLPIQLSPPVLDYAMYYRGVLGKSRGCEWDCKTPQQYEAEMKDLKAHGIDNPTVYEDLGLNPDGSFDFTNLRRVFEIRDRVGMPNEKLLFLGGPYSIFTDLGATDDPSKLEKLKKMVREVVAFARKHGYCEVYFYGVDEASGEGLRKERETFRAVHEAGGKVFVACYEGFFEDIGDLLDLPVVAFNRFGDLEKVHSIGHKMYNYANPQCGREEPLTYRRNYGLWLWKSGLDGACDYAYQHAFGYPYDDFTTNCGKFRHHMMAYPTVDGVIPTIQWEGWREGVNDVRYLSTLLDLINKSKPSTLLDEANSFVANIDPDVDLDSVRRQIASYILKLQKQRCGEQAQS